ncbi:MAG: FAD-binding protein, partial [Dehalococcoidia bacterium]|nr:FAD-binding protein [Dehalococcoidia bacterium]
GGPETTVRQEVIGVDGKVIPGLFAAGEVTGYQGYGTGMFNTGCVVFGSQAGRMAAHYSLYCYREGRW